METPRPAATKLHRKLKNRMYRFAERHNLTGFEAAGIMFALATEVMASALVRDGLLQGGPDWAEEGEGDTDATDATDALAASDALADMMEVTADAVSDAEANLLAMITWLEKDNERLNGLIDNKSGRLIKLHMRNVADFLCIKRLEAQAELMQSANRELREQRDRYAARIVEQSSRIYHLEHSETTAMSDAAGAADVAAEPPTDADTETTEPEPQTRINELLGDTQWLSRGLDMATKYCTEPTEANARHLTRIAQLEDALRVMADFALSEIKEHQARLAETVVRGVTAEELRAKEMEVLRQSLQLTSREARINDLLHRCGLSLTIPTQEPQP